MHDEFAPTFRALVSRMQSVHPDDMPAPLDELRATWIKAGCPVHDEEHVLHPLFKEYLDAVVEGEVRPAPSIRTLLEKWNDAGRPLWGHLTVWYSGD